MINFRYVDALTFDCFGTLIDWETGIMKVLAQFRDTHGIDAGDDDLLQAYARAETHAQLRPWRRYREVLRDVMSAVAAHYGVEDGFDENALAGSLPHWQPFPDTVASLSALKRRFRLGIISNIDDDLFAPVATTLEVPFDWVVTAEQAGAYKPSLKVFRHALEVMDVPMQRVVHVAQSRYHDIGPLNQIGWPAVWVNRRHGRPGASATQPFFARPALEVDDLAGLVRAVEHQLQRWDG
jgi:2-haloacid dehalogenase